MNTKLLCAAFAAALSVGACSSDNPNADTGTLVGAVAGGIIGNQFGHGGGRVASTMVGAVAGGIIGNELGRRLDERDRVLAQRAEYDALDHGYDSRPVSWRNPDNGRYGEVIPGPRYRRGAYDCRDYTHKVYIDGRPQIMRGTACRNPDGTWQNMS